METKLQPSINIPNHAISFYIPPEDFLPVPFLFNLLKYRLYTPTLLTSKKMSVTEGKAAIMMNEKKHDREERGSPMCLSYWTTWYMCTPSVIWIQILFFSPFFSNPHKPRVRWANGTFSITTYYAVALTHLAPSL